MAIKKICILGLGHAGVPLAAVLALKCPEIRVTVVQTNSEFIFQLNVKQLPPPIYVPGLGELIRKCQNKNLFFTTSEGPVIKEADIIFIISESKLKTNGDGQNQAVDLSQVEEAAHLIADHAESDKIVVENSGIPIRAAECIRTVLKFNSRPGIEFQILSSPEFYEEGSPIRHLLVPDCVLIGSENTPKAIAAAKALASIYSRWVPPCNIITRKNWTVELSKLSTGAMVSQKLASIYAMAALCEESGGDLSELLKVLRNTVGPSTLEPNLSVGRCPSIIHNLIYMCEFNDLTEVADYWRQVLVMYGLHKERFFKKLIWTLNQTAWNKRVAVLGFAYHKGTEMTKGSIAIELCKALLEESATVSVYDPRVTQKKAIEDLVAADCVIPEEGLKKMLSVFDDPYKAVFQAQVIVGCGICSDFTNLDYQKIYMEMVKPAFVFDSGQVFPHSELLKIGFKVYSGGKFVKNLI